MKNRYGSLWAKLLFLECVRYLYQPKAETSLCFDSNEWLVFVAFYEEMSFVSLRKWYQNRELWLTYFAEWPKGRTANSLFCISSKLLFVVSVCIAASDSIFYKVNLESATFNDETIVSLLFWSVSLCIVFLLYNVIWLVKLQSKLFLWTLVPKVANFL